MAIYDGSIIQVSGFDFRVNIETDNDHGAPWEECDGHGPVTDWERRDKKPGELILNTDRGAKRFYDFSAAVKQARAEGWNAPPYEVEGETPGQRAAKAARADYEYLRRWCRNDWAYQVVTVTLLDDEAEECGFFDVLGGVEDSSPEYLAETVKDMADNVLANLREQLQKRADTLQATIDNPTDVIESMRQELAGITEQLEKLQAVK